MKTLLLLVVFQSLVECEQFKVSPEEMKELAETCGTEIYDHEKSFRTVTFQPDSKKPIRMRGAVLSPRHLIIPAGNLMSEYSCDKKKSVKEYRKELDKWLESRKIQISRKECGKREFEPECNFEGGNRLWFNGKCENEKTSGIILIEMKPEHQFEDVNPSCLIDQKLASHEFAYFNEHRHGEPVARNFSGAMTEETANFSQLVIGYRRSDSPLTMRSFFIGFTGPGENLKETILDAKFLELIVNFTGIKPMESFEPSTMAPTTEDPPTTPDPSTPNTESSTSSEPPSEPPTSVTTSSQNPTDPSEITPSEGLGFPLDYHDDDFIEYSDPWQRKTSSASQRSRRITVLFMLFIRLWI